MTDLQKAMDSLKISRWTRRKLQLIHMCSALQVQLWLMNIQTWLIDKLMKLEF